ncbi:MAG: hypothetical protein WCD20_09760 [Rhodomicrobium sp.]
MTSADYMRFVIIVSLGALAFVTFLVAGTIIGLMWVDSFSCGTCKQYPVGIYILGILGILYIISISVEASEAPLAWSPWVKKNKGTLAVGIAVGAATLLTFITAMNSRWWF